MATKSETNTALLAAIPTLLTLGLAYMPVSLELAIALHAIAVLVCLELLRRVNLSTWTKVAAGVVVVGLVWSALAQQVAQRQRNRAEEQRRALFAEGVCPFLVRPMKDPDYERFQETLEKGNQRHVRLYEYGDDPGGRELRNQLARAFSAAEWIVDIEPDAGSPHGLRFRVYDDANAQLVAKVQNAFQAARVPTYIQQQKGSSTLALEIQIGEPLPTR